MLKSITILEIEKHGKKFPIHLGDNTTFGELFDVAMELREFAIKGINELGKKDIPTSVQEPQPVEVSVPKEFTE